MGPLASASHTSILFADPTEQNFRTLQDVAQQGITDAFNLLASAAFTASITPYLVVDSASPDWDNRLNKWGGAAKYHVHVFSKSGPTWSNSGLAREPLINPSTIARARTTIAASR
ncbi:MAG: hypothetical protein AB7O44_12925 [Hyphomicrobiaceae bacterium]